MSTAAASLDGLIAEAKREADKVQTRAQALRLMDEEMNHSLEPRHSTSSAPVVSPNEGRKRLLGVLGWRFRDIFRLWRVAHPAGSCEDAVIALVCTLTVVAQVMSLSLPVYSGRIVSALTGGDSHGEEADGAALARNIVEALAVVCLYIVLRCTASFAMMLTGIRWRTELTQRLQRAYMEHMAYFKVQLYDCDNPDQRIASDVANFTKICCGGVSPPYSSVLGALVGNVSMAFAATVVCIQRAGLRVTAVSYVYNAVTILLNVFVSLPIAASTAAQEAREGDFRRSHLRVRTYAESIAFYCGHAAEEAHLNDRFGAVISNQRKLTLQYFRLVVTLTFTEVGGGLIGLIIAAVSIWTGHRKVYTVAELSAVLGTLDMLTGAIQALPGMLPEITTIAGLSKRVIGLHRVLEAIADAPPSRVVVSPSPDSLGCENLTISTPDCRRCLVRHLSLSVFMGQSVVICGESGCGKSSLLRCLAGLWDGECGKVFKPMNGCERSQVVFLPQKPYMCPGSLRAQVIYPFDTAPSSGTIGTIAPDPEIEDNEKVVIALEAVGMAGTLNHFGLDAVEVWEDVLSLGEQQRLSFARLLYHRPVIAIMDEATSALDVDLERMCLMCVQRMGIATLSVAHRPSVIPFHHLIVRMHRNGTYDISPATGLVDLHAEQPADQERNGGHGLTPG